MKDYIKLYISQYKPIQRLSLEQKGRLLDAVFLSAIGEDVEIEDDPMLAMAFSFISNNDTDRERDISEKRREAGRKGSSARWSQKMAKMANDSKNSKNSKNDICHVCHICHENVNKKVTESPIIKEVNSNININNNNKRISTNVEIRNSPQKSQNCGGKPPLSAEPTQADEFDEDEFMAFFNNTVKGSSIPSVRSITKQRKASIKARQKEYGPEALRVVVQKAANSTFLNGGGNHSFIASFDWIFRPNNFPKVLEGNYDNHNLDNHGPKQNTQRTIYQQQQLDNLAAAQQHVMAAIAKTMPGEGAVPPQLPDDR